jgi:hypothetical protein
MRQFFGLVFVSLAFLSFAGCEAKPEAVVDPKPGTSDLADKGEAAAKIDDHSGWWCSEHGVPEEVCALCDTSLIADFKSKGDWCEDHNRPDSQCFTCNPERLAVYAARYEAKFGGQPPKPTE